MPVRTARGRAGRLTRGRQGTSRHCRLRGRGHSRFSGRGELGPGNWKVKGRSTRGQGEFKRLSKDGQKAVKGQLTYACAPHGPAERGGVGAEGAAAARTHRSWCSRQGWSRVGSLIAELWGRACRRERAGLVSKDASGVCPCARARPSPEVAWVTLAHTPCPSMARTGALNHGSPPSKHHD